MAAKSFISLMCVRSCFARSYQNPLSFQSFNNSKGAIKPNSLFLGMFKSSIARMSLRPPGGARTPFERFSSLPSIVSCREFELVCALKVILLPIYSSGNSSKHESITIDFPTPTLPTSNVFIPDLSSNIIKCFVRTESTVGIMILKNGTSPCGSLYVGTFCTQGTNTWRAAS